MSTTVLLAANYLPAVSYFHVIHQHKADVLIEKHEHYPKQTYRNRAKIATANGILDLTVPIVHGRKDHVPMKDIQINYDHDWQRLHWLSIQTAYRSSAYFEFYEEEFAVFYEQKFNYLLDFNMQQLELLLKILKISPNIGFTERYGKEYADIQDYRDLIHPKKPSVLVQQKPYYQVFEERHGFIEDLSIIDLIFNQGPQSKSYL